MKVVTTQTVVDAIAVADPKCTLTAVAPDRDLNETWEDFRKGGIEAVGIYAGRNQLENVAAAPGAIAAGAIEMVGFEARQNSGPMQKVVNQSIDHDQGCADFQPQRSGLAAADQQLGECQGQHFVGDAM